MYYDVNPSTNEKVVSIEGNDNLHESVIAAFNNFLDDGSYSETKVVFENTIHDMMEAYLFQYIAYAILEKL